MAKAKSVVASASRKSKKRTPKMINQAIVASYLTRLEAALGDSPAFLPLFESMVSDPEIGQAEAVALATAFVSKTSDGTSRAKALERVLKRHTALASFRLKQRAMAGRSAA